MWGVMASLVAANRDPEVYGKCPRTLGELDVYRPGISHHVALGFGSHQWAPASTVRAWSWRRLLCSDRSCGSREGVLEGLPRMGGRACLLGDAGDVIYSAY
ncbi:hypothetical protein NLS1_31240 [Nocardioides sp. LS1]|nr:hypothetical protein NLS1_31240 [Nocardioides sp. LS1]